MRADDSEVEVDRTGLELEHGNCAFEQNGDPARAVVRPRSIDRSAIVDAAWADNGPGWVAVLLESAVPVLELEPGAVDLDLGIVGPHAAGSAEAWELRAFFPKDGATAEDPVTGSLNASVAMWLLESGRATAPYVARQGTALGRQGRIRVSQDD